METNVGTYMPDGFAQLVSGSILAFGGLKGVRTE